MTAASLPTCRLCKHPGVWRVRLLIVAQLGETRDVELCGRHVLPFKRSKVTDSWVVDRMTRLVLVA